MFDSLCCKSGQYSGFKQTQQANFEAERRRWHAAGLQEYVSESLDTVEDGEAVSIPEGVAVESICRVQFEKSNVLLEILLKKVTLAVIEAMKIEIPIVAPERMKVEAITIEKGQTVKTGQVLFTLAPVA